MKRILLLVLSAIVIGGTTEINAQGWLRNLGKKAADAAKRKVEEKVEQKVEQKVDDAINGAFGIPSVSGDETNIADAIIESDNGQSESTGAPTATDRVPKLRQTSFVWDGQVTPSRATTIEQLLNELPPLPSAQQIANPDVAVRENYYNRISAVNMRVGELDAQWTCSEADIIAAREKAYKDMEAVLGLTVDEMKRLEDPNISETEKNALQEKMQKYVLGGVDASSLETTIEQKQQKYAARMAEIEKESAAFEKKLNAGTATEADMKRMQALAEESMAIQQDIMSPMSGVMDAVNKAKTTKVNVEATRLQQKLKEFSDKALALRQTEASVVSDCEAIAKEYEKDLQDIYSQVYKENDVDKIHALYDRADDLMKNYRERAAEVWLKSLNLRLENTKKLLPEAERVYTDLANNEIIPSCIVRRAPLNVLVSCEDLLDEAYADFPQPSVLPYHKEPMNILKEGESVMFSESGLAGGFDNSSGSLFDAFSRGCKFLVRNDNDGAYYKLENGTRTRLDDNAKVDFSKENKTANFSVGMFQMKPSFVEQVEAAWMKSAMRHAYRLYFDLSNSKEQRERRFKRITDERWQCVYLAIFVKLMDERHSVLKEMKGEERIRLLATAYNMNFNASLEELQRSKNRKSFHTDLIASRFTRYYEYAGIAVEWYVANTVK